MPRVEWCTAGASVWKEPQVRALPRSGWAAAGMLLFASAACAVADPPSTGSPAPPSSFLTGVPTEPTKTKARVLPTLEAGVLPTLEAGVLPTTEAGVLPTLEAGVLPSPRAEVLPTPEKPQRTVRPAPT